MSFDCVQVCTDSMYVGTYIHTYTCVCMFVIHIYVLVPTHIQCFEIRILTCNCLWSSGPVEIDEDMGGVDLEVRLPETQ